MCAPIRTALAEASVSLVRSLSEYPLWKDQIASAILEGLQEVRNMLLSSTTPDKLRQSDQQGSTESNFNGVIEVVLIFFLHGVLNALHTKWFWSFVLFFSRQRKTFDLLNNFENYFRKKMAFPYTTPSFVLVFGPHWL